MALQQARTSVETHSAAWMTIFPNNIKTLQGSTLFVKQLTALAFSCITYMRKIFPEYAYQPKELDNVKVKILTGSYDCKDAYLMTRWIKSAFQALDKKYMRELIFEILSVDNRLLEYYAIIYKYHENGPSCSLSANSENLDFNADKLENATKNLIRTLLTATEELEDLPENYRLQLRINYYDEVTPDDYKPKYFTSAEPCDLEKLNEMIQKEIGTVETPHHAFTLYSGSRLFSLEDYQQKFFTEMNVENSTNIIEETEQSDSEVLKNTPETENVGEPIEMKNSDFDWTENQITNDQDDPSTKDTQVVLAPASQPILKCICNIKIMGDKEPSENDTFKCVHCNTLHHRICYRKLVDSEIENGCCYNCSNLVTNAICTDPALAKSKLRKASNIAAYRQFIIYLQSLKIISYKILIDFGLTYDKAENMLNKLKKEKLIKPDKNTKGFFLVNNAKLRYYIKTYFSD